ncbi:DeoR/GlpR family DNA-binding transcription regulator [uncultured Cellulomonas sp.]|uniref:DeoR/GlpR family DNA-binding transcription regulator n=1 Tax=uncultured Cellulomonas sp. TaxID=189682 RepID=UPI00260F4EE7|nr:DeoR/GlpR family DNA-binding transcription regulator [uncultured Cellulomonas sp.]
MLATQRQERILAEVRTRGAARVTDLVAALDVSDMTVRRDIAELARRGLVRRVYGGAVSPPAHRARAEVYDEARAGRGSGAGDRPCSAGPRHPESSIALSAGSTTHALAEPIAAASHLRPLTVVTNSVPVSDALHAVGRMPQSSGDAQGLDVVLTGGVRTPSDALVGPVADAALGQLRVDRLLSWRPRPRSRRSDHPQPPGGADRPCPHRVCR